MPLFLFDLKPLLTDSRLLAPLLGGAACGLAYLLGRRWLFSSASSSADGEEMSADFLQGVTRDRRAAPRRRGNTIEVLIQLDEDQPPIRGWVENRSAGGLGILVEQAIPEGSVVKV